MKTRKIIAAVLIVAVLMVSSGQGPARAGDAYQVVIDVLRLVQQNFWREVSPQVLIRGAIDGIMASLNDPYSNFLPPVEHQQFMQQVTGAFAGIGVRLEITLDGARITQVFRHSPAARAGLHAGDIILFVGTQDVRHLTLEQLSAQIRGEVGTEVTLSVYRGNVNTLRRVTVKRDNVVAPTAEWRMLEGQIGYIRMDFFGTSLADDITAAMADLENARGLVLDMRGNRGGLLQSMMQVAPFFVRRGPMAIIVYRGGQRETVTSPGPGPRVPLVVLVDERTASAAEILAGAIQDSQSGVLVGAKTHGKGVAQSIYDLGATVGAIRLTVVGYLTPSGREINNQGLTPDLVVTPAPPDLTPPLAGLLTAERDLAMGAIHPEVATLHRALAALGFYEGPQNDRFTAATRLAIMRFQQHFGLYRDGLATKELLEQVNLRLVRPPVWRDAQLEAALGNLRGRMR